MVYTSFISCGMNEWRLLEGSNVVSGMIEGINHYWATIHCIHWNFCMLVYTEIWQVVTTKLSEQTSIHFFQLTLLVCQLELCCFSAAFLPLVRVVGCSVLLAQLAQGRHTFLLYNLQLLALPLSVQWPELPGTEPSRRRSQRALKHPVALNISYSLLLRACQRMNVERLEETLCEISPG